MKKSVLIMLASAVLFATACRGERSELRRDQQEYDVVQEGAGGAVTSTLQAPGETALPPLTGTNADTTSAFTLPTTTDPTQSGPPGTIAGTFTTGTAPGSMPQAPATPPSRPAPRPTPPPQPAPSEPRQPEPQPEPPPTTTTTVEPAEPEPEPEPEPQPEPQPAPQPPPPPPTGR